MNDTIVTIKTVCGEARVPYNGEVRVDWDGGHRLQWRI